MKKSIKLLAMAIVTVSLVGLIGCKKEDSGSSSDTFDENCSIRYCNDTTNSLTRQNGKFFVNEFIWTSPKFAPVLEVMEGDTKVASFAVRYPIDTTFTVKRPKGTTVELFIRLNPNSGFDPDDGGKYDFSEYIYFKQGSHNDYQSESFYGIRAAYLVEMFSRSRDFFGDSE